MTHQEMIAQHLKENGLREADYFEGEEGWTYKFYLEDEGMYFSLFVVDAGNVAGQEER